MKILSLFFLLLSLCVDTSAQDITKKNQTPVQFKSSTNLPKKLNTQNAITYEVNLLLDSLANKSKGDVLLTSTVKVQIERILYPYWKSGKLLGTIVSQAYFIQTGLQSMTKMDIEKGRLIITVGIAVEKPAEFLLLQFVQLVQTKRLIID